MEEMGDPIPQSLPAAPRKRNFHWISPDGCHQQSFQNSETNWNPDIWEWDSVNFMSKPSQEKSTQINKAQDVVKKSVLYANDHGGEDLITTLNLGGNLYSAGEESSLSRPSKRVRFGGPAVEGTGNRLLCQVDDCKINLSNAKDYHRRHKVCGPHSKTAKSLVRNQLQRFCQQCSRFHPLLEFDEGRRSCRRRLLGHNRRRRKTQPENVSSQVLVPGIQGNTCSDKVDVFNLLAVLAHLHGDNAERMTNGVSIPDRDQAMRMLGKINGPPFVINSDSRFATAGGFDLNVSEQVPLEQQEKLNGNSTAFRTTDSLATLSAAATMSSTDTFTILSQRSSHSKDTTDKAKLNYLDNGVDYNRAPSVEVVCKGNLQSPTEGPNNQICEDRSYIPLQLFSAPAEKYFSDSSNPMEETSPSSSPPLVQKLFPVHGESEIIKNRSLSISGKDSRMVTRNTTHGRSFKRSSGGAEHRSDQNLTSQAGYTSSSGYHSPSSLDSDVQDMTGRIIFKLFDKDPSKFPATLKTQIYNWLSNSPSEMESYIRPGCVVLSIYVALPVTTWAQLQEELPRYAKLLVQDSVSDFWRSGRFLLHMDRQLVSHKNGNIHLCKSWRTMGAPELFSVSPLAVVSGQVTTLALSGRNLTFPGTKVHCTYMGKYMSKKVELADSACENTSIQTFIFPGGLPLVRGRCFIEVENGFKGNSFPVIIADASICRELRLLASAFDETVFEDRIQDYGREEERKVALHFLNELGWLFQKNNHSISDSPYFSHSRFRLLFVFSIERDWSSVVKTLLDIFVESNSGGDGLSREALVTLDRIHLLNRAVKRNCIDMVNLLIHYTFTCRSDSSKKYLFTPNKAGHGGITPLHLAACTQHSEQMVDVLTNDPQEIGLVCWTSQLDGKGQSPYAYALMRNNHSYNQMVAQKLSDLKCRQVSIPVGDSVSSTNSQTLAEPANIQTPRRFKESQSCARCSAVMTKHYKRMTGAQALLYRPYVHSMLAIAAVCVCVCLFLRGSPDIGRVAPFKWENVQYGTS